MLRRRRVHVVFIAMSVCQQLAAAIERKDSIVNDSLTSSLTLFGYTSVKPVQLEAIHVLDRVRVIAAERRRRRDDRRFSWRAE